VTSAGTIAELVAERAGATPAARMVVTSTTAAWVRMGRLSASVSVRPLTGVTAMPPLRFTVAKPAAIAKLRLAKPTEQDRVRDT